MRRHLAIALTLALTASACATHERGAPPRIEAGGAPAPVEGYDWFLHTDEAVARLAYGLAESDDLQLGLACERASRQLVLSANAPPGATAEFYLESGGDTERFPAQSEPSPLHDGVFLTAGTPADAPVFQRFRRLGWVALWQGEDRRTFVPQPGSAANIERFFAFCG